MQQAEMWESRGTTEQKSLVMLTLIFHRVQSLDKQIPYHPYHPLLHCTKAMKFSGLFAFSPHELDPKNIFISYTEDQFVDCKTNYTQ